MDNPKLSRASGNAKGTGTRGRLIAEAEILVRTRGYAGFSYANLAEAVGIPKASIHHHFPAKEDLGAALIYSYRERYDSVLKAIDEENDSLIAMIDVYAIL